MTTGAATSGSASAWLLDRLAFLRALKAPSASQRLLLALADLPQRTRQEEREFTALVALERINERADKAKIKAYKIVREKEDVARRLRTRRLIELGALFDLVNLGDTDRGVLLGGLIEMAQSFNGPEAVKLQFRFKAHGDALLAQREKGSSNLSESSVLDARYRR